MSDHEITHVLYFGDRRIRTLDEAMFEIQKLPSHEIAAMRSAFQKLLHLGPTLGYPHSSHVKGTSLRELRPRAGRSPWRAFYVQEGSNFFIVAAVGPEAMQNPRGFRKIIDEAEQRLIRWREEIHETEH